MNRSLRSLIRELAEIDGLTEAEIDKIVRGWEIYFSRSDISYTEQCGSFYRIVVERGDGESLSAPL